MTTATTSELAAANASKAAKTAGSSHTLEGFFSGADPSKLLEAQKVLRLEPNAVDLELNTEDLPKNVTHVFVGKEEIVAFEGSKKKCQKRWKLDELGKKVVKSPGLLGLYEGLAGCPNLPYLTEDKKKKMVERLRVVIPDSFMVLHIARGTLPSRSKNPNPAVDAILGVECFSHMQSTVGSTSTAFSSCTFRKFSLTLQGF